MATHQLYSASNKTLNCAQLPCTHITSNTCKFIPKVCYLSNTRYACRQLFWLVVVERLNNKNHSMVAVNRIVLHCGHNTKVSYELIKCNEERVFIVVLIEPSPKLSPITITF